MHSVLETNNYIHETFIVLENSLVPTSHFSFSHLNLLRNSTLKWFGLTLYGQLAATSVIQGLPLKVDFEPLYMSICLDRDSTPAFND